MKCKDCLFVKTEMEAICGCIGECFVKDVSNTNVVRRHCPEPIEYAKHTCHYQHPTVGWPEVKEDDFCGHFMPKEPSEIGISQAKGKQAANENSKD